VAYRALAKEQAAEKHSERDETNEPEEHISKLKGDGTVWVRDCCR
jgi:hypothetical protein